MSLTTNQTRPIVIERDKTQALELKIFSKGLQVVPTSGTLTILDGSGEAVVDAAVVVVATDGTVSYSLAAATVPITEPLSHQWRLLWELVVSTVTERINQDAHFVRYKLYPVLADSDLEAVHTDILDVMPKGQVSWQTQRDAAFEQIERMIYNDGKRPYLYLTPWSLVDAHRELTLSKIFRNLSTFATGAGRYSELARDYEEKFQKTWTTLVASYDYDEDGKLSSIDEESVSETGAVYLSSAPKFWRRRFHNG